MTTKDIALQYLRKGYSVIPLNSPSTVSKKYDQDEFIRRCKMPIIKWKEYQIRLPTEDEVTTWFEKWPDANIGIVTGKVSNLVVFDLDSPDAVQYAEGEGGFPQYTPKVKTGKGHHIYMRHPGFEIRNDVNKRLDIDIRADGGYVAAPPSMHGSGRHYEWEEGFSIFDYHPEPCEPWMIDYLKTSATQSHNKKAPADKSSPKLSEDRNTVSKPAPHTSYADIMKNGAQQGQRNHTAAKLIGHLLGKGNDLELVWQTVKQWNANKNNPPLDHTELRTTFESIRDLDAKNGSKQEENKDIDIDGFLDNEKKIAAEHNEQYLRVSFSGELLSSMESKMNGGLIGGRTYVLGGIPSSGKTVLTNNIADNICLSGHPVLFFSYDDGVTELRYRSYSRFSGFDIEELNKQMVTATDLKAIFSGPSISSISPLKYVVQQMIKVEDWPQLVEKIKTHHQMAPVIIVDYLRKVRSKSSKSDERLRVDEILSSLTGMAKTYNIPVLVISELARDSYKTGQRLSMASFKESGSIEYEASWLGILAAVEEDGAGYSLKNDWERIINQDGNIDLIVFKAKRGTGVTGRISLKLDKLKMTVRDRVDSVKTHSVTLMTKKSKFA